MLGLLCAVLGLAGCGQGGEGVRYVVGAPYQVGGMWRYPAEAFTYEDTGIATLATRGAGGDSGLLPGRVTANGEPFDAGALAAGHRTLQLPAIVRITNLENGRQVVVRVNDRGPADPARLVAVTRRTAQVLGAADPSAFRVRVQVLETESRQVAAELQGQGSGAPAALRVAAAPRASVQSETLAPPSGASAGGSGRTAAALPRAAASSQAAPAAIPLRLPEQVSQVPPRPGQLAIECGAFGQASAAEMMRGRLAGFGARVTTDYSAPRDRAILVRIGPQPNLQAAEATLRRALPAGCLDGRIVIE